jgi:hypothetical protein
LSGRYRRSGCDRCSKHCRRDSRGSLGPHRRNARITLDEIAVLLDALYAPTSPTATWQAMGEAKLAEIEAQAARLQQMRRLLTEALSYCHLDLDRSQIIATALGWADRPRGPAIATALT